MPLNDPRNRLHVFGQRDPRKRAFCAVPGIGSALFVHLPVHIEQLRVALARHRFVEQREPRGIGLGFERVPDAPERVRTITQDRRERLPRLHVQRREMQQFRTPLDVLVITRVPRGIHRSPQSRLVCARAEYLVLAGSARKMELPQRRKLCAIEQHYRRFFVVDAQHCRAAHIEIEEFGRIREIDLVDVVVNCATLVSGESRDAVSVLRKTRLPCRSIEALEIAHQVNFVRARGVAVFFDRPHEYTFCAELRGFGAARRSAPAACSRRSYPAAVRGARARACADHPARDCRCPQRRRRACGGAAWS